MGVCDIVRESSLVIEAAYSDQCPDVVPLTQALASMPELYRQNRLDLWEKAVQQSTWPDRSAENEALCDLLDAVFAFGQYNLYGAFIPSRTKIEYDNLVALFSHHGLLLAKRPFIVQW